MNLPRPFLNRQNPLRPAIHFLTSSFQQSTPYQPSSSANDAADPDFDPDDTLTSLSSPSRHTTRSSASHSRTSSTGADLDLPPTPGIPLIDFSRTPSPSPYRGASATQSEDEGDTDYVPTSFLRPLVRDRNATKWSRDGGLGAFLFGKWTGWQVYVAILTAWWVASSLLLGWMNRVILWSGVYKFPYPLAATWIQLFFAHMFLVIFSGLTRWLAQPLRNAGLSALVAPSYSSSPQAGGSRMLGFSSLNPVHLVGAIFRPFGGIAGGGLLEFDKKTALAVLPLAITFSGKVLLSNISFAYAAYPLFTLCRIGILPATLLLTSVLTRHTHSVATLSSALTAWLNLLVASIESRPHVTWEAIVAGIFSILFTSLYPILLTKTHKQLIASQVQNGDVLTSFHPTSSSSAVESGSKQSTRAYYQLLHYTSLLSLTVLAPCVLASGEMPRIFRNCYFLDVLWFWFICMIGGLAAFSVFATSLAYVRATSPLTSVFVSIPRAAVQIVLFSNARLPVHSWVGVALCWVGSAWYALVRREESRAAEARRIHQGR